MINIAAAEVENNLKPKLSVLGVGGAGCNAVNNMINSGLEGVDFIVANTDAQSLSSSKAQRKIQLGITLTKGLGAGADPEVGKASAEESLDEIVEALNDSNMVFITAGMGGGTGSGACPVIAEALRERGILTVGVVTKPFTFEGSQRSRVAEMAVENMKRAVDTLIIIPNQNLFNIVDKNTSLTDAFNLADKVLHSGVSSITDLIVKEGRMNKDFADIREIVSKMGEAMMGTGEAEGENRAIEAAEKAISNPLLDNISMKGAQGILLNITGSNSMTLFDVDAVTNRIRAEIDQDDEAEFIIGTTIDDSLGDKLKVSIVATGMKNIKSDNINKIYNKEKIKEQRPFMDDDLEDITDFNFNNIEDDDNESDEGEATIPVSLFLEDADEDNNEILIKETTKEFNNYTEDDDDIDDDEAPIIKISENGDVIKPMFTPERAPEPQISTNSISATPSFRQEESKGKESFLKKFMKTKDRKEDEDDDDDLDSKREDFSDDIVLPDFLSGK